MLKLIIKQKKFLLLVSAILFIGFISGIFYYIFISGDTKEIITLNLSNYTNSRFNFILKDLIVMSLLFVASFFVIGGFSSFFYIFYEGLSLGFLTGVLVHNYQLNGLIYSLIYFVFNRFIVLFLLFFFIKKIVNLSFLVLGLLFYRKDNTIKKRFRDNILSSIYLIVIIVIINVLIYFINPYIFNYFTFLIK